MHIIITPVSGLKLLMQRHLYFQLVLDHCSDYDWTGKYSQNQYYFAQTLTWRDLFLI